jgi:hypothetical protein
VRGSGQCGGSHELGAGPAPILMHETRSYGSAISFGLLLVLGLYHELAKCQEAGKRASAGCAQGKPPGPRMLQVVASFDLQVRTASQNRAAAAAVMVITRRHNG